MKFPFAGRVYVDSPILIYTIEHNPPFAALLRQFWTAVAASAVEVVTSELSILETLVNPIRLGDSPVIAEYEEFSALPEIQCWPIDRGILRRAAEFRADRRGLRTPDSIHVATAQLALCRSLFTNDAALARTPGMDVVIAQDLTDAAGQ